MLLGVPLSELFWLALAIVIAGVITGLLAGLFGIGGGAVMVLWDAKDKRVVSFDGRETAPQAARGDRFLYSPIFASPDRMIVWYSWSPVSEQGRIFDMSGKQLAIVGGKHFAALGPDLDSWLVQGTEWAIKGEGNTLVTVDVHDPRVTSTYDLSDLLAQRLRVGK